MESKNLEEIAEWNRKVSGVSESIENRLQMISPPTRMFKSIETIDAKQKRTFAKWPNFPSSQLFLSSPIAIRFIVFFCHPLCRPVALSDFYFSYFVSLVLPITSSYYLAGCFVLCSFARIQISLFAGQFPRFRYIEGFSRIARSLERAFISWTGWYSKLSFPR